MMKKLFMTFVIITAITCSAVAPAFAENANAARIHAAIEKNKAKKTAAILACKNAKKKTRKCVSLLKKAK